ncbi:MAG: type II toxin-antitoxin system VapC family toxin [bacterium]
MTHLLDTCTWLRALGAIGELNAKSLAVLHDPSNAPFALSAISVWEVCTKIRKKPHELSLALPLDEWLSLALQPGFVRVIPVDAAITRLSNELPGVFHEDPADRLIVATAKRNNLIILTSDDKILNYSHVKGYDTR